MTREVFTEVSMDSAKEPSKLLAQVVLITREMLECAEDQAWAKVTCLEEERRNLLARCFANPACFAFRFLMASVTFFFNSLADSLRLLASSLLLRLQCLLKKFKSCNCSLVNSGGTDSVLKGDGVSHIRL